MSRMNWGRVHQRRIMHEHGCESVDGETPGSMLRIMGPPKHRPRPRKLSKEELRAQAAAAFVAWRERQQP
jgi:hypothetical protein